MTSFLKKWSKVNFERSTERNCQDLSLKFHAMYLKIFMIGSCILVVKFLCSENDIVCDMISLKQKILWEIFFGYEKLKKLAWLELLQNFPKISNITVSFICDLSSRLTSSTINPKNLDSNSLITLYSPKAKKSSPCNVN